MEKVQITVRLPRSLNKLIEEISKEKGVSKNFTIITKLWELKQQKEK